MKNTLLYSASYWQQDINLWIRTCNAQAAYCKAYGLAPVVEATLPTVKSNSA